MRPYRDKLSLEEIAEGMALTLSNAEGLLDAASTLFELGQYGFSYGLASLALEEAGKLHALRAMAQRGGVKNAKWRHLWTSFRSHHYKSSSGLMDRYPDTVRMNPELLLAIALEHGRSASDSEHERQKSLYVDFCPEQKSWTSPGQYTEKEAANQVETAGSALERARNHADAGLLSLEALIVLREIYEPFFADLLSPQHSQVTLSQLRLLVEPFHRVYFERIVAEGILDPEAGIELLL